MRLSLFILGILISSALRAHDCSGEDERPLCHRMPKWCGPEDAIKGILPRCMWEVFVKDIGQYPRVATERIAAGGTLAL